MKSVANDRKPGGVTVMERLLKANKVAQVYSGGPENRDDEAERREIMFSKI